MMFLTGKFGLSSADYHDWRGNAMGILSSHASRGFLRGWTHATYAIRAAGPGELRLILRLEDNMDSTQSEFDQAYWASEPPEIVAAFGPPSTLSSDDRTARAVQLAQQGFTIDIAI